MVERTGLGKKVGSRQQAVGKGGSSAAALQGGLRPQTSKLRPGDSPFSIYPGFHRPVVIRKRKGTKLATPSPGPPRLKKRRRRGTLSPKGERAGIHCIALLFLAVQTGVYYSRFTIYYT
jgi:hypothetical protein